MNLKNASFFFAAKTIGLYLYVVMTSTRPIVVLEWNNLMVL